MRTRTPARSKLLRDLGRRVAELRDARGLTQQEYSERLNVSLRYIQSIEAGRENLSVESLGKLAKALRVSVAELFTAPASTTVRRGRPPKRRGETE
ncbi:MAG: helix-turn-helix transcriptional regulator [Candidatus Eisenbacteria bacterium]|nr:helix-turn-helix transcriptional regulator [Candidatus Eisenbacteria bacterium]